jgi:hypothetical protein
LYQIMAEATRACGQQIQDAKAKLDAIDKRANEEIQKVIDSKGGWFGPLAMLAAIWTIVTEARSEAIAVITNAVQIIAQQAILIEGAEGPSSSASVSALDGSLPGGSRNSFGLSVGFGEMPAAPPPSDIKQKPVWDSVQDPARPAPVSNEPKLRPLPTAKPVRGRRSSAKCYPKAFSRIWKHPLFSSPAAAARWSPR